MHKSTGRALQILMAATGKARLAIVDGLKGRWLVAADWSIRQPDTLAMGEWSQTPHQSVMEYFRG